MAMKKIDLGNKIELTKLRVKSGFASTYISQIQDIIDEDTIVISAPSENGKIIPLMLDSKYHVCLYTKNGLFRCLMLLIDRSKKENLYLITMKILTPLEKFQRREFYRLNYLQAFKYKDAEKEFWQDGLILDISGGGIRFLTKQIAEIGKQFICHIQLEFEEYIENLYITGELISSIKNINEPKKYENRIEFRDVPKEDRETIIKFIFEEQRKRRKQNKG